MLKKIIKLLLIIICMVTIFMFSSDNREASTKKSDGVIVHISEAILGRKLTDYEKINYIDKYVLLVRKGAHFSIYFLLGLFVISFFKEFMVINRKTFLLTVIFVFLYACSDEIHQLFVPGRSCEVLDVLIDTCGGGFAAFCYMFFNRIRRIYYE